jgi:ABC-2 type transport system ATP-binding protein
MAKRGNEPGGTVNPELVMIEADNLSKYYGSFAATDGVSFRIAKGEVVAFLGPNGAGKSTTMKLLTGYISPSTGVARIAGHNMTSDRLAGAQRLGYLPENGPLYPDMSPYELLHFFADARRMTGTVKANRIDYVINACALGSVLYKSISKLSKGYRQRVGVAQALLQDPEVLILDEPTAGLDPNQIHDMRETLRRLGQEKTILLSTHIMQEVAAICGRVIMINLGKLVYDGPVDTLTQSGESMDDAFRRLTASSLPFDHPSLAKERAI